ncbi:MAG: hypothetical protein EKK46_06080 [Rhodocyclaceae bacterium]|nr:MAG: hypothetical protein EKK46_06080 [Rhodocyclaceae bacterium]
MGGKCIEFHYRFELADGRAAEHVVRLDAQSLALQPSLCPTEPREWTQLEFHQCSHCPLRVEDSPCCPVAEGLADLLDFTGPLVSHAALKVEVTTPDRTVTASTTAQRAVSSLMGLVMAASACPHMSWLRPMARFHLPLASEEETLYRAASMYLLAQYFRHREGLGTDLALAGLRDIYQRLHTVNMAMAERLRAAAEEDASVNAVVILDLLAKAMPASIEYSLEELEYLFRPYLGER